MNLLPSDKHGFTLVELSIVLVILGLLVGGILAGQSLIRASELRAVGTEYQRYVTAANAFRDKYFFLPGDINNATSIWGAAHATPSTCRSTTTGDARTCDGDGDGRVLQSAGSNEIFRFWQQLTNAGLLEGQYSGVAADGSPGGWAADATNVPASKASNGYWWINYTGTLSGDANSFDGVYNHAFRIGGISAGTAPGANIFFPGEAWNIDTKLDDGLPATGKVRGRNFSNCATGVSSADMTAIYRIISNNQNRCQLWFTNVF